MPPASHIDPTQPGKAIRVLARITALRTDEGGKAQPFGKNYRPNHNFGSADCRQYFIGQVKIPDDAPVHPGETHVLPITFLWSPGLDEILQVGREWRIQEGSKLVATATALEVHREA